MNTTARTASYIRTAGSAKWALLMHIYTSDIKFAIQIGSDWNPNGTQISDFLRSVSVHFGSASKLYKSVTF